VKDLFGHVQRTIFPELEGSNVRMLHPAGKTLHVSPVEPIWFTEVCHAKADALFNEYENALVSGRMRRANRKLGQWLSQVQADRVAFLKAVASERGLRLGLPNRAEDVVETWNGAGNTFDALFIADEPIASGHFPVHDLVGAVSVDGRSGDWFILDRWAS
jgi:hypothetical protein